MIEQNDYAKRMAAIDARIALYDGGPIEKEHADREWLLAQLRAVETALTAAGIPSDGRALAERIGDLVLMPDLSDADADTWAGDVLYGSIDLRADTALALQKAVRDGVQHTDAEMGRGKYKARRSRDAEVRAFTETQRKMQAEIERLTEAVESAGASAVSERARAERAEEERDEAQAALRAAKVLAENGTPGESAKDILRAAEMLKRWENGATVKHDCGGSPTCPMCAVVVHDNGQEACKCGGSGPTYIGPHLKGQAGCVTPRTIMTDLPEPQAASWFDPSVPPLDPEFRALVSGMCSPPRQPLSMIVAVANNGVIGKDGRIPWKVSEDLRHFKRVTMGHTCIVGRKTFEGLPPLSGRRLVGVSRKAPLGMLNAGIRVALTVEDAIGIARETDPEPIVIGGAEVYRAALPYVTRIYLTEIGHDYEGDTTFHLDRTGWREVSRRAGETPGVSFVVLIRSEMEERLRRSAQPPPEPDIEPAVGD